MKTVKVDVIQVFNGKNDVRKHLRLDLHDEDKEYLEEQFGITESTISEVLYRTKMWVDMRKAYDKIELVVNEE